MDSLYQGWQAGIRAAQDEERGRGAGAGDTGEEKRVTGLYQVLKDNDIDFRRKYAEGEIIPVQEVRP